VTGDIVAHLFASTTGTDSDWVVKLIVPILRIIRKISDGRISVDDCRRDLSRPLSHGFEKPTAIVAKQVNEYVIDLHAAIIASGKATA